jgi:hypothetical protein
MHMDVLMDEDGTETEYRVRVMLGDQLRAELEAKKLMLTESHYMHTTALWAWAAMVREGNFAGKFREFQETCIEAVADKAEEADPVDPTHPAASTDSA